MKTLFKSAFISSYVAKTSGCYFIASVSPLVQEWNKDRKIIACKIFKPYEDSFDFCGVDNIKIYLKFDNQIEAIFKWIEITMRYNLKVENNAKVISYAK